MRVAVYTNIYKDEQLAVTRRLLGALRSRGAECSVTSEIADEFPFAGEFSLADSSGYDFVITAGGDGTVLKVAKSCAESGVPIMGINLGHVGFLTEEEPSRTESAIDALFSGEYRVEERTLLRAEANGRSFVALNDVVAARKPNSRLLETDVIVDGEFADKYFCDGFIVSTPTGSTAYSLSAGGSILSPSVAAFILTPINSHSLHSRPLVVSENSRVTVRPRGACSLAVDGEELAALEDGASVNVVKHDKTVKFVRLGGHGFYGRLLGKLNKWSVTGED